MKKIAPLFFVTILFSFFLLNAKAQDITLSTQAQVDAFNNTEVNGTLTITGSDINNLNGLSELTKCQNLLIVNNPVLTSVIGLANLGEVEHTLSITNNTSLTNLTGFSSLTTVGTTSADGLTIGANANLTNVDGLFSLTFAAKLVISGNPKLANLNGLSALTEVEHFFFIINNPLLTSISGLSHLTSISSGAGNLTIDNNDALTNLNGLSGLTYAAGLVIKNNATLANLDALSNLDEVKFGGIDIENNAALTSLSGLSDVGPFGADLKIIGNPLLTNLNGLSGITGLTDIDAEHNLEIKNNSSLTSLDGLAIAGISGDLIIDGNPVLTDIGGLSNLTLVKEAVRIKNNFALPNVDGLSSLTTIHALEITSNHSLANLDGLSALHLVVGGINISSNPSLTDFCGLYNLFHTGDIGGTIFIKFNGANTLTITPRSPVTVNADAGLCSAVVSELLIGSATVEGCLVEITGGHSDFPPGNVFPVGTTNITWTATDGAGNVATAIQMVTVIDNQPPTIITHPSDITVSCASDVPAVDLTSVTASDNCPGVTISHVGDVITNQTCANRFTLTRTYRATDAHTNTADYSQVIIINDNVPPQISGLSVSQSSLWPANHTMRDITVNYTVTDNCISNPAFSISISSNEPVNGVADGDTDPDWEIMDNHHIRLRAERASNGNGRIYTITITASDGCNDAVTASTQVMVVHNITGPVTGHPFRVGSVVDLTGEFWDKPTNKHSAKWLIDDNTSVKGTVTEPTATKNGKLTGSYKFGNAGVYKLQMNITDQTGTTSYTNTNGDLEEIIVIYDPNGGYVYGGGSFNSPAGALKSNPTAMGKVSYGFTVNYFKNATYPKGETQFEFKVGGLEFNAVNFDYLAINGATAQFKGSGRITGDQSGYAFIMTVTDGQLDGSGVDKLRIKIYNKNTGETIYDNQPGASDAANPVIPVGLNSSITISSNAVSPITTGMKPEEPMNVIANSFDVNAYPNPTNANFSLKVGSTNRVDQIKMQVIDVYGRVIETRLIASNQNITFGQMYKPGAYYVRVIQGKEQKQIKLIKLSD